MNDWFTKNLGDAMLAWQELENIKEYFQNESTKNSIPKESLVLMRHDSEGRLHCEVKVFFSPSLAQTALKLGALQCQKPSAYGMSLLAGSESMWRDFLTNETPQR